MLPSKELIQTILEIENTDITYIDIDSENNLCYGMHWKYSEQINIHEFAFMCKEWLKNEMHQCIWSGNGYLKFDGYSCTVASFYGGDSTAFLGDTENEAVFNACEDFLKDEDENK